MVELRGGCAGRWAQVSQGDRGFLRIGRRFGAQPGRGRFRRRLAWIAGNLLQGSTEAQDCGHLLIFGEVIIVSEFKSGGRRAEADGLARLDLALFIDPRAIDVGSVARVEFAEEDLWTVGQDHAVLDGNRGVGYDQMVLVPSTDGRFLPFQLVGLTLEFFVDENEFCHGRSIVDEFPNWGTSASKSVLPPQSDFASLRRSSLFPLRSRSTR